MSYVYQLVLELINHDQMTLGVMKVLWEVMEDRQQPGLARIIHQVLKETLF